MDSLNTELFSLQHTLECGQFFRYKKLDDGSYLVNYKDVLFVVKQVKNKLFYSRNVDAALIMRLFRLDDDLGDLYRELKKDPYLKDAIVRYSGLRLMRQDPWECMISYICSSASNIPKIQKNIENLSRHFGKPIVCEQYSSFSFPKLGSIDDFEKILESKTGYRAKFIKDTNGRVDERFFSDLRQLSYADAKKKLMSLNGIGEKIADCILLFSLDHMESFPIDTWIAKAMKKIYGMESEKYKDIQGWALERWGKNAGYAQQYIYMMIRNENRNN